MLDVLQGTRINSDAAEDELKSGEYRDALNISSIANEVGAFSKGTTYGNLDTNIVFKGLNPDAICLGSAIDTAGSRIIVTFFQKVPIPFTDEYQGVLDYAVSRFGEASLPSPQVQAAQNFLIFLLKQDGIWNGLDVFYCFFGDGDESFAKINWKLPNDATTMDNHGVGYQVNFGFKSTGNPNFLNTKWIPSTAVHFQLNNAEFVIGYEEITPNSSQADGIINATFQTHLTPHANTNSVFLKINANADPGYVTDPQITDAAGLAFVSRPDGATQTFRKNTSDSFVNPNIATGRPAIPFYLAAINSDGSATNHATHRYSMFAAGENLNTFDRETKLYKNWLLYKNSFVTPLVTETYAQEVLMYLLVDRIEGVIPPLVKSSLMMVKETSYLDGYSFINDLFYFNFRESAPKMINIQRALDSPGFYDRISETSLTVIKPHPPFSPVPVRTLGTQAGAPIQKKPFQFMMVYNFVDGEQSTKSPASEYVNSLDDRDAATSLYDHIQITMDFPQKDYTIVENVELYVRNNNNIADWRSVNIFKRDVFFQAGENYRFVYDFYDNVVGNFLPLELSTKINDAIPQRSNYLAFIENRLFMIDSLLDYDFTSTFQIKVTLDVNPTTIDDRAVSTSPLYGLAEFEYDSEYTIGAAFYDKYGRKYPASVNDVKLVTPAYTVVPLPRAGDAHPGDGIPRYLEYPQLKKAKITGKYDLRAAGNINNYGKPPSFAFWWGMIRGKNTKWEFQKSAVCLLRFPYSITKWPDTDPAKFPDVVGASTTNLFLEDGYLYWNTEKLLYGTDGTGLAFTTYLVNDYIDVVIPPNFPFPIDGEILIDFMHEVTTKTADAPIKILDREVIATFANKVRIRGDRNARWFSNAGPRIGQYKYFPIFTTGVYLNGIAPGGSVLRSDETLFQLIIKRRRKNNLENIIMYDTPQVYPVTRPGTKFASFQPTQSATIVRAEYPPLFIAPDLARTLNQGDILIQPIHITPTTVAFNHAIKILWGPNAGDDLRLKIKVSLWQLNDLKQPIIELYSATGDAGGPYTVKNNELGEYLINADAELIDGWYGYGISILEATATNIQFNNPDFDINVNPVPTEVDQWYQSPEATPAVWRQDGVGGENFAYVNVNDLGAGYSKTLYQLLQANKDELTIEIVVEGVSLVGPPSNGPIIQRPGNIPGPPANNSNEQIADLNRLIVPYYIDCDTPKRKVTLNTLTYTVNTVAPIGGTIRAEIWRIDQVTKRPISMIEGSDGLVANFPTVPGTVTIPLGVNKVIDTTGWYGIGIFVALPTFSDFTDKNYANGGAYWNVKSGSPTWTFQPDTTLPDVYGDVAFVPAPGTDLGYLPMNTQYDVVQPILFGADPGGYTNHRIGIDWGDNQANGWHGRDVNVAIFELDQVTKKPLSYSPIAQNIVTIASAPAEYVIAGSPTLLPNTWYGFSIRSPRGHTQPNFIQFSNASFNPNLTGWSVLPGVGATWTGNGDSAVAARTGGSGAYDSGTIRQALSGYAQVVIPVIVLSGFTSLTIEVSLNSTPVQIIDLGNGSAFTGKTIVFESFFANGGNVGIRLQGSAAGSCSVTLRGIYNSFDPYLYSTPRIRKSIPANANYESWMNFGSTFPINSLGAPRDAGWREGFTYFNSLAQGQVGTGILNLTEGVVGGSPLIYLTSNVGSNGVSPLRYGFLGMESHPSPVSFTCSGSGQKYISSPGSSFLQIWAFNNPADFIGSGVMVDNIQFLGNDTFEAFTITGHTVTIPAGYKYVGYRFLANGSAPTFDLYAIRLAPSTNFNSWEKDVTSIVSLGKTTLGVIARERYLVSLGGFTVANFHADNIAPLSETVLIGQDNLTGAIVKANIELFVGAALNNYTLSLYDSAGTLLGSTAVVGQAVGVGINPQITVNVVNAPSTTGLYLTIRNNNSSGAISVRIRQISNFTAPVYIGADNSAGYANARTWRIDSSNNPTNLATTSVTRVDGTEDVPQPANATTIVLADASGAEISAPQTFIPNQGKKTLLFAPTLAVAGNLNYGVKVKNNPLNSQTLGTIRIHSVQNIATNDGIAHIIGHTTDPVQPLYEAWNQFSLGAFVRAGYVSNFIAVVDDLVMSAFTPVQINPTSYHVVSNIVAADIPNHSMPYGSPPDTNYNYGIVYPSIASDPDAAGIVFEQKTGQSIGDINIKIVDQRQKSQSNIVRWSDPVIAGTRINNLNAFLDSNKYSVDFQRGAIEVMIAMHDHTLFCVHTQGMSSLYVQRATMTSAAEAQGQEDQLFLTNKVVGNDNKLTSNLGTVNPESVRVVESGTIAYGFDLVRKSFWQKTNNGVRNLTYECNAKNFFNQICFFRLLAHNNGDDVKIYSGYNEKQKSFYLTFAPFVYKGQPFPGVTIAYNAYIDGFLSRYSFEPMSYLATEDVIHSIKARELTNPDFLGDFSFWKTVAPDSLFTANWSKALTSPVGARALTPAIPGTRILNPDFIQGPTSWVQSGTDATWSFVNDGAEVSIAPGFGISKSLINVSGAIATYQIRVVASSADFTGVHFYVYAYDALGASIGSPLFGGLLADDQTFQVAQSVAGRIGIILENQSAGPRTISLKLFTTVVRTYVLYQPMPTAVEDLRVRLSIPARTGSIQLRVFAFNDPLDPFTTLLKNVSLIRMKDAYTLTVNVPNTVAAKYIGLYAITDYDVTNLTFFDVNSVPSIWKHDQTGKTNNFFGVQYDSMIELVFAVKAGQIRIFNSLGIMSESAWSVERFTTSDNQISALDTANFRLRDGMYTATILRNMLTPQESLPDPVNNVPILHGAKLTGIWIKMVLRNSETLRQIELKAAYIGSDELAGNMLGKK